jgi:hypothetical protein
MATPELPALRQPRLLYLLPHAARRIPGRSAERAREWLRLDDAWAYSLNPSASITLQGKKWFREPFDKPVRQAPTR